ncbi:hypothetical protein ACFFP0_04545 [Rhizobium puerariae]|uniref:Uncharacterized protein n=1 Tax=Rhizobium puerariae TaxID=1585791 RepID=A0ABV6AEI6_9HYPH
MAGHQDFDGEIRRIGGALNVLREALAPVAAALARVASEAALPEEEGLAAVGDHLKSEAPDRHALEASIARLTAGLSAAIEEGKREFDAREVPTRFEKLIGLVSGAAMRRRQRARWRNRVPADHLAELLRRADVLVGLVRAECTSLLAERREGENDLVAFIDHRPEILEKLRGGAGAAMSGVEAVRQTERFVELFQAFVDRLNANIGTCNVLLHKLMADTEDLLILYRVVSEAAPRHGSETMEPDAFPHLASAVGRMARGMLTVHGLERRLMRVSQAFAERFPKEAAEAAATEPRLSNAGWRPPAFAGFRPVRS